MFVQLFAIIFSISTAFVNCSKDEPVASPSNGNYSSKIELTDDQVLDSIQKQTFKFFWNFGHPVSGLSRDRNNGNNEVVTSGGTGFGIMVIIVGIERGYISYDEGLERIIKICKFLNNKTTRYHGAWAHFINGSNGNTVPFSGKDNGADLVETAFVIEGILTARTYFNKDTENEIELRSLITSMWKSVEWTWFIKENNGGLLWHWSPNYNFDINMTIHGFDETMITYILALCSPTYPISKEVYDNGWVGDNYTNRVDPKLQRNLGGPLFFTHYSFLGLSPYFTDAYLTQAGYSSYFERNKEQTLLNRQWCINQNKTYGYYNENCWGLTASDDPDGYMAHAPAKELDNGTISPTAAISSIVYTPTESIALMRYLLKTYGYTNIWGEYGFVDAFNYSRDWIAESYLAIDQGPIVIMIENYRTGLLWDYFMRNSEIDTAFNKIGLTKTVKY
ncbi:MAG: beta-glucosidase [Salinivirgaceae bacterium]|nr:beta-glucosidase [Salinivirgaceae bacterium]